MQVRCTAYNQPPDHHAKSSFFQKRMKPTIQSFAEEYSMLFRQ